MNEGHADDGHGWVDGVTIAAPGLLGAAAGLLLGELMHKSARHGVALGLIGLGVAALLPVTIGGVRRRVNAPGTKRGSRRRLRGIRDAGLATAGFEIDDDPFAFEDLG